MTTCGTFREQFYWLVKVYTFTIGGYRQVCELLFLIPVCPSEMNFVLELQMRRPHKDRYRLDRLLEKKAKEGVKIYIIL